MKQRIIRYGVVGVKGFSQRHIEWINRAAFAGAPVKLAAAATIFSDSEARAVGDVLARDRVVVVESVDDLLALRDKVDIITLPVGIHLHTPLAIKVLGAGYPVYMEKPVAGTVDEVAALAAAEKASGQRLFVGFQTLYQPSTWILKRRLLDGVVGTVKKIVFTMAWQRSMSYYRRNHWAGKMEIDGFFIYDCPMNNSMGHFLNAALFLAGSRENASAVPIGVEAELYRATPIESADSTFCRFVTREGVEIVFNASQSAARDSGATLDIIGDKGKVLAVDHEERVLAPWIEIDAAGRNRVEGGEFRNAELFERVAAAFLNPDLREISTLETAGLHTAGNQMAFTATEVRGIAPGCVERLAAKDGDQVYAIKNINESLEWLRREGQLPYESGICPWSSRPGVLEEAGAWELLAKIGVRG